MTQQIHNIYSYLTHTERDEILTLFENNHSITTLCQAISNLRSSKISEQAMLEALVSGYLDEGNSDKAEQITRDALEKSPNLHTHNLLLRCLLSSTRDIQQEYYDESINWSQLYEIGTRSSHPQVKKTRKQSQLCIGLFCNYSDTVFGETAIFPMLKHFSDNNIHTVLYNFSIAELNVNMISSKQVNTSNIAIQNVYNLSIQQLQQLVIDDQIEILFDLNGRLREDNRLEIFFNKPAPIQINYFNLVGTTGMKNFDFVIADPITLPKEDEKYYTEKVIHLPCNVNGAFQMKRTTAIKDTPFENKGYITFGCFNAFFKFNESLIICWSKILHAIPKSKIIIKNQEMSRSRVRNKVYSIFSAQGISEDQIILEGFTPMEVMKARYAAVDIALDTFPYSGGSTTLNALWQGVPVISLQGSGWRSNTASSMLASAGLETLICQSREEYLQKTIDLAGNITLLKEIRAQIKNNIKDCPYFRPDIVYPQLANALQEIRVH